MTILRASCCCHWRYISARTEAHLEGWN